MLAEPIETEIAALAERYGAPLRVVQPLTGGLFDPLFMRDRYGEVCMVVRRPDGTLITAIKTFYPAGAFRLLTGGVHFGEAIADALVREVAEETGLDVAVRRFLAVIEYELPALAGKRFATFAFLLDELGGELVVSDPDERIGAFRFLRVDELPAQAETLAGVPDTRDDEVQGSWRDWGRFRAVVHRVVHAALMQPA
ncbi:NUDIX hydrolase [Kouleothrix aurantiaca]|jgi:8-oxo-dGTP pyrophosphatase MutT (NUDIX family)|uniref:NUDIX hydrolase n=1 Tax=Kouleothrix aurantiaca TaxID=186479 RepID=A0A0P9DGJ5_9CHLR|nr:NUDIX hydrolase [Kouleothrix aurantiaca]